MRGVAARVLDDLLEACQGALLAVDRSLVVITGTLEALQPGFLSVLDLDGTETSAGKQPRLAVVRPPGDSRRVLASRSAWAILALASGDARFAARVAEGLSGEPHRVPPTLWSHVNIYRKYEFNVEAGAARSGLRPLREPSAVSA